ncbi:MAG: AI-2E family transporter [bacterium]|nr:AI-2E family transporter [bacterium]
MEKGLEISWTSLWRVLGMLILISVLYVAMDIWVAVLLSIVISSALDPSVSWLEKKKIPRVVGTLGIYILVILTLAIILYTIVPLALTELNILLKNIGKLDNPAFGFKEAASMITSINESLGKLTNILLSGSASFLDTISKFIGGLALTASVFVLSFYLTVDRDGVEKFLRDIVPTGYEEKTLEVYFRTRDKIGQWLYGQIFLSLSVGVSVFLGLWFIGVKYSLVLGLLAGFLEIVPFVGPILSGAFAFLIAATGSLSAGVYVFFLFLLIQQVEAGLLAPVFMRLTTSLHPAAVLVSLLIGAELFGFIGMILAVPVTVALQEIMENWSSEKLKRRNSSLSI